MEIVVKNRFHTHKAMWFALLLCPTIQQKRLDRLTSYLAHVCTMQMRSSKMSQIGQVVDWWGQYVGWSKSVLPHFVSHLKWTISLVRTYIRVVSGRPIYDIAVIYITYVIHSTALHMVILNRSTDSVELDFQKLLKAACLLDKKQV